MSILDTVISSWDILNTTAAAGTEPTDLAVDERTYLTILASQAADASGDGKISFYRIGDAIETSGNVFRFRCMSATDEAACTFVLYSGTLKKNSDCDFTYLGTLAFVTGLQQSFLTGDLMCSQVTVTEGDTTVTWQNTTSADDDRVAEARIDLQGADIIVIVPTTVVADCKLIGKAY